MIIIISIVGIKELSGSIEPWAKSKDAKMPKDGQALRGHVGRWAEDKGW